MLTTVPKIDVEIFGCVLVYRYTKERNINELRHNSMYGYENNRNSPVYRYTRTAPNILSHRSLKSSRWFFLLFASFLIKIQICTSCKRKENVYKNTQLERNGFKSLKIEDDNSSYDKYGNILLRCVSYFNSCSS